MTLQHTSLEIRPDDVEAELRFWALLGFDHVATPSGLEARATWVARDGTHIHLLHADAPTVMPRVHSPRVSTVTGIRLDWVITDGSSAIAVANGSCIAAARRPRRRLYSSM